MGKGLREGEIKQGINDGGHIRNVVIVSSGSGKDTQYLAYILPSWGRDFLPLRTWLDRGDRPYRDLDRLLVLIRQDFDYAGFIPLYVADDPDLVRYRLPA